MRKKKYLPFYLRCINNNGLMPGAGLCGSLKSDDLDLFAPDECNITFWGYWGNVGERTIYSREISGKETLDFLYGFNPLRQNVVLFLAAMNNEL